MAKSMVIIGHFYSDAYETTDEVKQLFESNGYEIAYENASLNNFAVIKEEEINIEPEEEVTE